MKRNGKGQTKCGRQIETNTQTERGRQKEREADREVSWCFMPSQPLWLYQGKADREAYREKTERQRQADRQTSIHREGDRMRDKHTYTGRNKREGDRRDKHTYRRSKT